MLSADKKRQADKIADKIETDKQAKVEAESKNLKDLEGKVEIERKKLRDHIYKVEGIIIGVSPIQISGITSCSNTGLNSIYDRMGRDRVPP